MTLSDCRNSRPAASRATRSPWSSRRVPARAGESAAFVARAVRRDQLQPVIDRLASIPSPVPLPFGNRRSLAEAFSDTRHDDSSSANTSRSGGLCGHGRGRAEEHVAAAPPTVMSLFARISVRPTSDRRVLEDHQEWGIASAPPTIRNRRVDLREPGSCALSRRTEPGTVDPSDRDHRHTRIEVLESHSSTRL